MIKAEQYGPWAVIAGASEGIGASFAHQLGQAGINVVLIARNENLLRQVAGEVSAEAGVQVRVLALDLSREDMLDRVREVTDDLDVGLVVCNAAAGTGHIIDTPLEHFLNAIRLSAMGAVSLAHHFGGAMAQRGRGGIILMGSMAGNAGGASTAVYGACKAFMQIFAEGLWSEMRPLGVDVLYMVLGAVNTPKRAGQGLKDSPDQIIAEPDDVARDALTNIANGPVLVPEDIAEGFRHFSSAPRREAAQTMTSLLSSYSE